MLKRLLVCIAVCCLTAPAVAAEDYLTAVPPGVGSAKSLPLLVCLPAVGISAQEDLEHWVIPAGKEGFIVADLSMDYRLVSSSEDLEAVYQRIMRIADELARKYPVDRERIYLAGTSAGGMLALALGLRYSGRFAAIAVASGAHLGFGADQMLGNARGLSFFLVHGTSDQIIPLRLFEAARDALEKSGASVHFSVREGEGHPVAPGGYEWLMSAVNGSLGEGG
jgi:predicted esterase